MPMATAYNDRFHELDEALGWLGLELDASSVYESPSGNSCALYTGRLWRALFMGRQLEDADGKVENRYLVLLRNLEDGSIAAISCSPSHVAMALQPASYLPWRR
jgi:hypothetical protein